MTASPDFQPLSEPRTDPLSQNSAEILEQLMETDPETSTATEKWLAETKDSCFGSSDSSDSSEVDLPLPKKVRSKDEREEGEVSDEDSEDSEDENQGGHDGRGSERGDGGDGGTGGGDGGAGGGLGGGATHGHGGAGDGHRGTSGGHGGAGQHRGDPSDSPSDAGRSTSGSSGNSGTQLSSVVDTSVMDTSEKENHGPNHGSNAGSIRKPHAVPMKIPPMTPADYSDDFVSDDQTNVTVAPLGLRIRINKNAPKTGRPRGKSKVSVLSTAPERKEYNNWLRAQRDIAHHDLRTYLKECIYDKIGDRNGPVGITLQETDDALSRLVVRFDAHEKGRVTYGCSSKIVLSKKLMYLLPEKLVRKASQVFLKKGLKLPVDLVSTNSSQGDFAADTHSERPTDTLDPTKTEYVTIKDVGKYSRQQINSMGAVHAMKKAVAGTNPIS